MSSFLAIPGQPLSVPDGYLRGHGTFVENNELHSSVAGTIERVNKLVSVRPFKCRYVGNVGDVVVGRITEVGNKRWKIDVNGRSEAVLLLGSINLPGGAQRRRTLEDRLQMRQLFAENDVISCEVSSFYKDGGMSVQTRSLKYGKLENGQLVTVPPSLVKRVKHHFITLRSGVDLVLGHNGYIWLTSSKAGMKTADDMMEGDSDSEEVEKIPEQEQENEDVADIERSKMIHEMESMREAHAKRLITSDERVRISRVANSLAILANSMSLITPKTIEIVYDSSLTFAQRPCDMLIPDIAKKILQNCNLKV